MLFSIDEDAGNRIVGWILPDNPSQTPRVTVYEGGEKLGEVTARIMRPLLREQGLHDTGLCGFAVDSAAIPDLAQRSQLELYDAASRMLVYRRRHGQPSVPRKLFQLETQLLPNARLGALFNARFQMAYPRAGLLPPETINSLIGIGFTNSIYISGRVYLTEYETLLRNNGFVSCAYLRDPVEELAEQLLTLDWITRNDESILKQFGDPAFSELAQAMRPERLASGEDFHAWLLRVGPEARWPLTDPATRLLTCRNAQERLSVVAVASALDALAGFAVVGMRDEMAPFLSTVAAHLECDFGPWENRATSSKVLDLAAELRDLPLIAQMLAADLDLFSACTEAMKRAAER